MSRIACINLTSETVKTAEVSRDLRRLFLGGRGINTHLLYQKVGRETDPLGPENVLLVGAGLLTGVAGIANSRISFSAKSPETEPFERLLDRYYSLHGWDQNGVPKPETLKKLGLEKAQAGKL